MSDHWNSLANLLGTPSINPPHKKSEKAKASLDSTTPSPERKGRKPGPRSTPPAKAFEVAQEDLNRDSDLDFEAKASIDSFASGLSNESTVDSVPPPKKETSRLRSSWDAVTSFFGIQGSDPATEDRAESEAPTSRGRSGAQRRSDRDAEPANAPRVEDEVDPLASPSAFGAPTVDKSVDKSADKEESEPIVSFGEPKRSRTSSRGKDQSRGRGENTRPEHRQDSRRSERPRDNKAEDISFDAPVGERSTSEAEDGFGEGLASPPSSENRSRRDGRRDGRDRSNRRNDERGRSERRSDDARSPERSSEPRGGDSKRWDSKRDVARRDLSFDSPIDREIDGEIDNESTDIGFGARADSPVTSVESDGRRRDKRESGPRELGPRDRSPNRDRRGRDSGRDRGREPSEDTRSSEPAARTYSDSEGDAGSGTPERRSHRRSPRRGQVDGGAVVTENENLSAADSEIESSESRSPSSRLDGSRTGRDGSRTGRGRDSAGRDSERSEPSRRGNRDGRGRGSRSESEFESRDEVGTEVSDNFARTEDRDESEAPRGKRRARPDSRARDSKGDSRREEGKRGYDAPSSRSSGFGDGVDSDESVSRRRDSSVDDDFDDDIDTPRSHGRSKSAEDDSDDRSGRKRKPRRRTRGGDKAPKDNRSEEEILRDQEEEREAIEAVARHSKIPSWQEAIGALVESNVENHSRHSNHRGRGRGNR